MRKTRMNDIADDSDRHIVEEDDGWYFWDEGGQEKWGPYKGIEEARFMMDEYCKKFLDN